MNGSGEERLGPPRRIGAAIPAMHHEVDDAGRNSALVQPREIVGGKIINGVVVANVPDDDRIADSRPRKRDDIADAEPVAVQHFVVNRG